MATSTLAWGVNTPAHLVIIKGTEYFDAPSRHALDPLELALCSSSKARTCVQCGWGLLTAAQMPFIDESMTSELEGIMTGEL